MQVRGGAGTRYAPKVHRWSTGVVKYNVPRGPGYVAAASTSFDAISTGCFCKSGVSV